MCLGERTDRLLSCTDRNFVWMPRVGALLVPSLCFATACSPHHPGIHLAHALRLRLHRGTRSPVFLAVLECMSCMHPMTALSAPECPFRRRIGTTTGRRSGFRAAHNTLRPRHNSETRWPAVAARVGFTRRDIAPGRQPMHFDRGGFAAHSLLLPLLLLYHSASAAGCHLPGHLAL
jgi:hypothetical protein